MLPARLYAAAGAVLVLLALLSGAYLKGRGDGRAVQAADYAQERAAAAAAAQSQRAALQQAIDAQRAELEKRHQEGADDIAAIKIVHLPGRVEIQRRTVEVPVYRDCVAEQRVLELVNAARAGRPASADALRAADGVLPGGAAARE